ncbi:three-Cys-motif partner protein TcmP [Xanthomonas bundabergensis]|uniref:three-Cys-motif partner protein TcmP n=1 Tax=Xanthomonas bundabergensis TaxID=3160842 RepID=UPI003517332D
MEYEAGSDGYPQEVVGSWVKDKHELLKGYVRASRMARGKMRGEPCLLDLYCGPGRSRIRGSGSTVVPGGTLAAMEASVEGRGAYPFSRIIIGDVSPANVAACKARLGMLYSTRVDEHIGAAEAVVQRIASKLPRKGLHLAYLDPYALHALPFSVIQSLSRLGRVDLMIHFASLDMTRNLVSRADLWPSFDKVAPGWRDVCLGSHGKSVIRQRFFEHWVSLIRGVGYHVSPHAKAIRNTGQREIYRLVLASKHPLGANIWSTLRGGMVQNDFGF